MLVSTLVATFFVPLFFTLLEGWSERRAGKSPAAAAPTHPDRGEEH
jgi:hypothetical protein